MDAQTHYYTVDRQTTVRDGSVYGSSTRYCVQIAALNHCCARCTHSKVVCQSQSQSLPPKQQELVQLLFQWWRPSSHTPTTVNKFVGHALMHCKKTTNNNNNDTGRGHWQEKVILKQEHSRQQKNWYGIGTEYRYIRPTTW